ncbi:hypothetical protein [Bradyrhizobium sp. LA7.1]|uniref:hypothetical protein n=1 Tax=Bradyrhizobium sp. LA7.1 TaxID=3156324 RepID=UPI00339B9492
MKGKIVTNREVAVRWSYAEVTGRFGAKYAAAHQEPESIALIAKILNGALFDDLDDTERKRLGAWFDTGLRSDFAGALNSWYTSFRCESWSKSELGVVYTLPIIDPLGRGRSFTFASYLAHPRKVLAGGSLDPNDPAVAADAVSPGTPFLQKEPLVVGHWGDGKLVLWEGNFRAALFVRTADAEAEILVWVPNEGHWPKRDRDGSP